MKRIITVLIGLALVGVSYGQVFSTPKPLMSGTLSANDTSAAISMVDYSDLLVDIDFTSLNATTAYAVLEGSLYKNTDWVVVDSIGLSAATGNRYIAIQTANHWFYRVVLKKNTVSSGTYVVTYGKRRLY